MNREMMCVPFCVWRLSMRACIFVCRCLKRSKKKERRLCMSSSKESGTRRNDLMMILQHSSDKPRIYTQVPTQTLSPTSHQVWLIDPHRPRRSSPSPAQPHRRPNPPPTSTKNSLNSKVYSNTRVNNPPNSDRDTHPTRQRHHPLETVFRAFPPPREQKSKEGHADGARAAEV